MTRTYEYRVILIIWEKTLEVGIWNNQSEDDDYINLITLMTQLKNNNKNNSITSFINTSDIYVGVSDRRR